MATPSEIAGGATCFRCVPDQQSAILYLLATLAGVTDPSTIAANATCFRCVPDFESAMLYLLDVIATNGTGGGGTGSVLCGAVAPVAAPTGTCALYYDTVTTALYYWDGAAWVLKV